MLKGGHKSSFKWYFFQKKVFYTIEFEELYYQINGTVYHDNGMCCSSPLYLQRNVINLFDSIYWVGMRIIVYYITAHYVYSKKRAVS